jgi:hypothetical protein
LAPPQVLNPASFEPGLLSTAAHITLRLLSFALEVLIEKLLFGTDKVNIVNYVF